MKPVLFMSHDKTRLDFEAGAHHAAKCPHKPFNLDALLAWINTTLGRDESQAA